MKRVPRGDYSNPVLLEAIKLRHQCGGREGGVPVQDPTPIYRQQDDYGVETRE